MRIALGIEYDGTDFFGWQRLPTGPSVQTVVETALSFVAAHPLAVTCAGRTDTGVHARCQVVHFDSGAVRDERAWVMGANSRLPPSVALLWARPVKDDFSARFSARARRYRYHILNRPIRAALDARFVTWVRKPLDTARMHAAAQALVGEHDFTSFRALSCQAPHARRVMQAISVTRDAEQVWIDVQANAFLHHMVRNIVGSLLVVGHGDRDVDWLAQLLAGENRAAAAPTAPSSGLTFIGPRYPEMWNLPPQVTL